MLMSIAEKIAFATMGEELEDILAEANEIDLDNTKVQSFKKISNFTDLHQEVLSMINKHPKSSRRELASLLGWSINRVTPRVKELLEMNKLLVY
jgi:DNA-binding MarR family transcriptional regulator